MGWTEHVARMKEKINAYRTLVRRPEGKKPPRRPIFRWESAIKIDFAEKMSQGVEWIRMTIEGNLYDTFGVLVNCSSRNFVQVQFTKLCKTVRRWKEAGLIIYSGTSVEHHVAW